MQQCTHIYGITSESATRSKAQNSAYTAQNSTKVAQNSRCFRPVKIPREHLDPPECRGVHRAYVTISHKGCGTKFGVYGTKQHKSSTKFTVLQILENCLGTLRPTRMPQCTQGIMSESTTRSMAQSSAYTAQNSTKVAQNSRCFRPVKIPWEHLEPPEFHGVHMAYVRISHKGRGTKFGVYGTKQHKSSTKFWCGFTLESCWWQANLT